MDQCTSIVRLGMSTVVVIFALLGCLGTTHAVVPNSDATVAATTCPERVGHWPYGYSYAVAVDGTTAFFGVGAMLRAVDVSTPASPVIISEVPLGNVVSDIELSGDVLVAAISGGGVTTVDISDPSNPGVLDTLFLDGDANALAIADGHTLIVGSLLWVVDMSVPSNLVLTGTLDSGIGWIRDIAVSGSIAALADQNVGLQIIEISDPTSPTLLATYSDDMDRSVSVDIVGDAAVVLEEQDGIAVFDISNASNPSIVNRIDPGSSFYSKLRIGGNRLYVGEFYSNRLMIYDFSDPATPVELWNGPVGWGVNVDFAPRGSTLYSARGVDGLGIIDVSIPSAPQETGRSEAENLTRNVALWDTYAVTILAAQGLAIFDMSDPSDPVELSRYLEVNPNDFVVRDGYAYTINPSNFDIVDLTDPATPVGVATASLGGQVLALTGDLAVLGGSSDGIRVVDIGNLSAPAEVALINVDFTVSAIAATGPAFYVPEEDVGLHVFDVSAPAAPVETSLIPLPGLNNDNVEVDGGLLVVSEYGTGVRIFDVSNPLQPVETALYTGLTFGWSLAISNDMLVVGTHEEGLHILDLSDPTTPIHLGEAPLLVSYPDDVTAMGGLSLVAEGSAGFEVFDLDACALGPPAADFSWTPIQPWIGTAVEFTDASTGGVTAWSWSFGDGGASTASDPSHVYTSAGSYTVELSVTSPLGSDSMTRSITVTQDPPETPPIEQAGAKQWIIPAAAHSPGAQGTNWVSDVVIHNPGNQTESVNVYFLKGGRNNSGSTGRLIEIPGGTSTALNDIVFDGFGWSNASGAILIGCDSTLQVASRTYNTATSGTFGQFIPGLPAAEAAVTGDVVRLIQLTRSEIFRTNIGWANPGPSAVNLSINLLDAHGVSIGTHETMIPPFGYGQANDILPANIDDAMAVVSSNDSGARFFVYGSVVDNSTGDPILILEAENEGNLYIPAAAHVQGLAGTDWKTDLEIANPKGAAGECVVELLETGSDNSMPENATVQVPANSAVRVRDVLDTLFDHDGSAALRLRSVSPTISATSSTYNTTAVGTYGQFISGTTSDAEVVPTRPGVMIQLRQSVSNTDGFRTNLGLLNTTEIEVEILIELFASDKTPFGSVSTALAPFEHRQINRVFREVTQEAVANGVAWVSTTTPEGAFLAYASVVDNRSGDPVYIPAWLK